MKYVKIILITLLLLHLNYLFAKESNNNPIEGYWKDVTFEKQKYFSYHHFNNDNKYHYIDDIDGENKYYETTYSIDIINRRISIIYYNDEKKPYTVVFNYFLKNNILYIFSYYWINNEEYSCENKPINWSIYNKITYVSNWVLLSSQDNPSINSIHVEDIYKMIKIKKNIYDKVLNTIKLNNGT